MNDLHYLSSLKTKKSYLHVPYIFKFQYLYNSNSGFGVGTSKTVILTELKLSILIGQKKKCCRILVWRCRRRRPLTPGFRAIT